MNVNFNLGTEPVAHSILRSGFITVGEALRNNAAIIPDRIAIQYDGGKLTFAELNARVNRLTNSLLMKGVVRGDRIAVLAENRLEYCEIVYAAAKLGGIVPCLNWRLSPDELRYCIQLTTPETIFVSSSFRDLLEEIRNDLPFLNRVVLLDESPETENETNYASLIENGVDREPSCDVIPEDALVIIYTSGTTGYPKGSIISHRAIFGRAWIWVQDLKLSPDNTFLGWAPMFHMASMDQMLVNGIIGGKFIPVPDFDPEKLAHYLWTERLGWFILMPGTFDPMIEILSSSNKKPIGVLFVGAMADLVPPQTIAEITRLIDCPYLNTFGSTETGLAPATNSVLPIGEVPTDLSKKINTTCEIRLVDPDDNDVSLGEPGELIIRGTSLLSGYWNNDETNKEDFRGGWFHMGDVFTMNDEGKINFVDRRKYLIKSGGENIYPAEIERVLMSHPAIEEAVIVRSSDPKWGEVPKAYVASNDLSVGADELLELCKKNLASYKKPRLFEFIDKDRFPRSTTGKILRHEVEKWNKS
ncbi:MAG: class I adenylate-forming enzyme family protein [Desulfatiglans sp.]|nr:class I adenylate-forming enzyme family protein [Desulfatiglans sp.]